MSPDQYRKHREQMKTKMPFPAEIVIRKNTAGYEAGFASKTTGTSAASFSVTAPAFRISRHGPENLPPIHPQAPLCADG
jgi:hypothetical protein